MKTILAISLLAATLGGAGAAHAQALNQPYLAPGLYGSFGVGQSKATDSQINDSNNISVAWDLGYRFTPNLGAELFLRTMNFQLWHNSSDYPYPERHFGAAVTGSWPIAGPLNGTARLGLGQTHMKRDNAGSIDKTAASGGLGLALQMGSHIALTAGFEHYTNVSVNIWNVGWELRY